MAAGDKVTQSSEKVKQIVSEQLGVDEAEDSSLARLYSADGFPRRSLNHQYRAARFGDSCRHSRIWRGGSLELLS